jgi:hypothetical protein
MGRRKGPLDHLADWARYKDEYEKWTVMEARRHGLSWDEIAQALGRSRQSVWEHWREADAAVDHKNVRATEHDADFAYIDAHWTYDMNLIKEEAGEWVPMTPQEIEETNRKYLLRRLGRVKQKAARNEAVAEELVKDARSEGAIWADIGGALRISRKAAWRKYSRVL